jgi:hypothetical protein
MQHTIMLGLAISHTYYHLWPYCRSVSNTSSVPGIPSPKLAQECRDASHCLAQRGMWKEKDVQQALMHNFFHEQQIVCVTCDLYAL